jgi:two-component system sensor histidine kinase BaeS
VALPEAGRAHWDAQRIEQLLSTLLENSLRYTDAPGRVALACAARGQWLEITVDDTAPGVPEPQLERLFDPLFRLEGSRSRHSGGSGLGLAIARAIAASHGGRIAARRSPLGGLGITLALPRVAPAPEAPR